MYKIKLMQNCQYYAIFTQPTQNLYMEYKNDCWFYISSFCITLILSMDAYD
jgi:hypothetical protein